MLWTGGAPDAIGDGSLSPLVTTRNCAAQLRSMCRMDSPAQTRAMACTTTVTWIIQRQESCRALLLRLVRVRRAHEAAMRVTLPVGIVRVEQTNLARRRRPRVAVFVLRSQSDRVSLLPACRTSVGAHREHDHARLAAHLDVGVARELRHPRLPRARGVARADVRRPGQTPRTAPRQVRPGTYQAPR